MLLLSRCKEPRSCSLPSMVSRASGHWFLPQILILLPRQSLHRPDIEIAVFRSNLIRSSHFGLKITQYKSSNAPNLSCPKETFQVRCEWFHRSCELLTSTRRPLRRKSYSEFRTPLFLPSTHLPGTGSWTKQFVIVSSSIFRTQSSKNMLRRVEFMIATGWLLYASAVLPASAQMCLNWEAPRVRKCLRQLNFWLKDFVSKHGRAWKNFGSNMLGSPASSHHYYCSVLSLASKLELNAVTLQSGNTAFSQAHHVWSPRLAASRNRKMYADHSPFNK